MYAGAAKKQLLHRDYRDWRGCRVGGAAQLVKQRSFYVSLWIGPLSKEKELSHSGSSFLVYIIFYFSFVPYV